MAPGLPLGRRTQGGCLCVFATSGWEPETVTAYLLKAASLFERLA